MVAKVPWVLFLGNEKVMMHHCSVNITKATGLYTINGQIMWYVNYIPIKLFKQKATFSRLQPSYHESWAKGQRHTLSEVDKASRWSEASVAPSSLSHPRQEYPGASQPPQLQREQLGETLVF